MFIAGFPSGALAANCYLIAAERGAECLIVDPGENALEQIDAAVREHGLRPAAVLLTHGHLDHAAAFGAAADSYGVPGHLHPADAYMLDDPLAALSPELRELLADYEIPRMRPQELLPLTGGDAVAVDGLAVTVLATPGHTGGSVVFRLAGDGDRPDVLFTGDTLFAGSVGRTDLPGGSVRELGSSLRSLVELPAEAVLLPGHGPRSTIGQERRTNPFLMGRGMLNA